MDAAAHRSGWTLRDDNVVRTKALETALRRKADESKGMLGGDAKGDYRAHASTHT
jgi:hypothetical protein